MKENCLSVAVIDYDMCTDTEIGALADETDLHFLLS